MKEGNQGGFGVIGILVAVGVVVLGVGAYASLSTPATVSTGSDDFVADPSKSGIENMADNMAKNVTDDMMEAVEDRNEALTAEIDSTTAMEETDMKDTMDTGMDDMKDVMTEEAEPAPAPAAVTGTFQTYSADKLALAENGNVVLFFHADWCPSCRGLENNLNANLSGIPANTHILKLDFDSETELKKKYGVVRQHTLVMVDADGNEIKKLTGLTNTLDQVVSQL